MSLRDEDISFPPTLNKVHTLTLAQIHTSLLEQIDLYSQKETSSLSKSITGHLRFMRAYLLLGLNAFNKEVLIKELLKNEAEEEKAVNKKKKGKGGASKKAGT